MRELPQFVLWRAEKRSDDTYSKVPYQPNGQRASSNNPLHWSSFNTVKSVFQNGGFDGIGFVFTKSSRIVGIDIDNVDVKNLDPDIELLTYGAWTEISISGNGIHLYIKGEKIKGMLSKKGNYECYDENRFFVITGNKFNEAPDILEGQNIINEFSKRYLPAIKEETYSSEEAATHSQLSNDEVISLLNRFKPKSMRVYKGIFSDYPSQSEAVLALMNDLAFYTGKDKNQMQSIYLSSLATYADEKQNNRKMFHAIEKAVQGTKNIYIPKSKNDSLLNQDINTSWWSENQNGTKTLLHNQMAKYITKEYTFVRYPNPHGEIYFFNKEKGIFEEDLSGRQLKSIIRELEPTLRASQVKEVVEFLKDTTPIRNKISNDVIALNNGLLNLKTFKLMPFNSEFFITSKIETNYNESAYDQFIEDTLKKVSNGYEPTIENIKEMFACVLYPGLLVPKMFYLYGRSAHNGKSSLINMIQYTFNPTGGNISAVTPQKLATNTFASASMYGKLANIVDDQPDAPIEDSGLLKTIITGGVIEIERKGKNSESVRLTTTMITASNYYPDFKESGKQINRRLYIIPFEYDFSKDPNLLSDSESMNNLKKIEAREYVLALAVSALKRMLLSEEAEKLTFNQKVQKELQGFANHNDPMTDYFEEFNRQYFLDVPGTRAYEDYVLWAKENGTPIIENKKYKELVMRNYNFDFDRKRISLNGKTTRVRGFVEKV